MKAKLIALLVAMLVGLPIGGIVAILLTPILWRLEPVLHMELAGHSGPSDWVFLVIWALVVPAVYLLILGILSRRDT